MNNTRLSRRHPIDHILREAADWTGLHGSAAHLHATGVRAGSEGITLNQMLTTFFERKLRKDVKAITAPARLPLVHQSIAHTVQRLATDATPRCPPLTPGLKCAPRSRRPRRRPPRPRVASGTCGARRGR